MAKKKKWYWTIEKRFLLIVFIVSVGLWLLSIINWNPLLEQHLL